MLSVSDFPQSKLLNEKRNISGVLPTSNIPTLSLSIHIYHTQRRTRFSGAILS